MNAFDSKLLDGKTKLHFVGIGGSGMFPLVQILHEVGYEITGSDVNEGDIIDRERKLGIPISIWDTRPKTCTEPSWWCIPPPS